MLGSGVDASQGVRQLSGDRLTGLEMGWIELHQSA
jgi:hypothetical protein